MPKQDAIQPYESEQSSKPSLPKPEDSPQQQRDESLSIMRESFQEIKPFDIESDMGAGLKQGLQTIEVETVPQPL